MGYAVIAKFRAQAPVLKLTSRNQQIDRIKEQDLFTGEVWRKTLEHLPPWHHIQGTAVALGLRHGEVHRRELVVELGQSFEPGRKDAPPLVTR